MPAGEHPLVDLHGFADGGLGLGASPSLKEEHPLVSQREGQFGIESRIVRRRADRGPIELHNAAVKRLQLVGLVPRR